MTVYSEDNTRFGQIFTLSNKLIESANFNLLKEDQGRAAEKFGRNVLAHKGWTEINDRDNDMVVSQCDFYVFTPKELREFVENHGGRM